MVLYLKIATMLKGPTVELTLTLNIFKYLFKAAAHNVPNTSAGSEMDLLGSLFESFSSNSLALVPAGSLIGTCQVNSSGTTNSEVALVAAGSSTFTVANQVGFYSEMCLYFTYFIPEYFSLLQAECLIFTYSVCVNPAHVLHDMI